jgi:hypothetical protein
VRTEKYPFGRRIQRRIFESVGLATARCDNMWCN